MESQCFCTEQGKGALRGTLVEEVQTRVGGAGHRSNGKSVSLHSGITFALNKNFRKVRQFVRADHSVHAAARAVPTYCSILAFSL